MMLYHPFCSCFPKKELLCCEVTILKELYMKLPTLLKKRIIIDTSIASLAIVLFLLAIVCFSDINMALPFLLLSVILIVKTAVLFYNCIAGNYLEIKGICSDVEKTHFRKRVKSITVKAEDKKLKLRAHYSIKNISIGDPLIVYISKKTSLHNQNGIYIANEYYGVSLDKED